MPKPYLLHAFSLDMLARTAVSVVQAAPIDTLPRSVEFEPCIASRGVAECVARELGGVPPESLMPAGGGGRHICLVPGDTAYVARYRGTFPRPGEPLPAVPPIDYWYLTVVSKAA